VLRACVAVALLAVLGGCAEERATGPGRLENGAPGAPTSTTSTTAVVFSGEGREGFCDVVRATDEGVRALPAAWASPGTARRAFMEAAEALDALAGRAPAEIAPDIGVMAVAYRSLVERQEATGWEPDRLAHEIDLELNAPRVRQAAERLAAYQRQVCGITG
jgi:hypothetical protein